jgi:1-acyl-sn-glycerol-3-phosphate acyltransferase
MSIRRSNLFYKLVRGFGYPFLRAVYRIDVEGRENLPSAGPGIILPKHQYWTDIPVVALAAWRPISYIAKQELFVYPGIRHFLAALGGIPLDRGNPVKTLDSFRHLDQLLKEKEFIVLFPEGTYYPNCMGRGKHRLIERILRVQEKMGWREDQVISFIPVGIRYMGQGMRKEVRVRIGKPLFFDGKKNAQEFTGVIVGEIAKLSGLS